MPAVAQVILILAGVALLFVGAELLVRGASTLGALMGIPPIVIGLTVVAFGTSAPELAVSLLSAARGESGLSVGNVVGSNIFNILAILGLAAVMRPLAIENRVIWRDVPIMLGVSVSGLLLAWDGTVSTLDAGALVLGLAVFLYTLRGTGPEGGATPERRQRGMAGIALAVLWVTGGLAILVVGARWLVDGATALAQSLGFSELLIGLTVVAAGTSLPELATSLVAAWRNERDIAVGNVVGSNVFNVLGVLGLSGLVAKTPLEVSRGALRVDFPVMIGAAVLCLLFFRSERTVSRAEGLILLLSYAFYTAYRFTFPG